MNAELRLIIQAIQDKARYLGHPKNLLDNLCYELSSPKLDDSNRCIECECTDCLLGYKDYQYYTSQIIKTWRQL